MNANRPRTPRLGRGLSTLMSQPVEVRMPDLAHAGRPEPAGTTAPGGAGTPEAGKADGGVVYVPVGAIRPNPNQPRQTFDQEGLRRLAESIRGIGLMQPIIVTPVSEGGEHTFQLVAGERRWRAARLAGLDAIPAIVRNLEDRESARWALIENMQREDLNAIERAHGFAGLINRYSLTHEEVADQVGVDRATVSNTLRLLNLHADVQQLVARGTLSASLAKLLAGIDDPNRQLALAHIAIRKAWSVRRLEGEVRKTDPEQEPEPPRTQTRGSHLADLERQIGEQLKTKVRIRQGRRKGSGRLTIEFFSIDHFDQLMARLGVTMADE